MSEQETQLNTPIADEWESLEERYRANHYNGRGMNGEVELHRSTSPFIISAPHSLNHFRQNKVKYADRWTGGLAEMVGSMTSSTTLIPIGPIPNWEDWNLRTDQFKLLLDDTAKPGMLLLDLHGMSNKHDVDICIGLGPRPSTRVSMIANDLKEHLGDFRTAINHPFGGKLSFNVCSYSQTVLNVDALQIEIAASLRDPKDEPVKAESFINVFTAALHELIDDFKP